MKQQSSPWAAAAPALLSFMAILALILDAGTAVSAAAEGIQLCLQTVVPSLFPFLVASRLFLASGAAQWCTRVVGPVMGPAFGLPAQGASALALGMLSGYPVGAQTAASLYGAGQLSKEEAERLLAFCSNAGPAFIFGMVGGLLGSGKIAAVLYAIHICSALLTGLVLRPRGAPVRSGRRELQGRTETVDLPAAVAGAVRTTGLICGYIVLFRVIGAFLARAFATWMPPAVEIGVAGLLELAGGCSRLPELDAAGLRYCMASGFLAFGGLCVWLQTQSVIRPYGLTGRYYLFGKILQGTIAVLLTWGAQVLLPNWLPRILPTASFAPNHAGLLRATGVVTALFLLCVGIWCLQLRKKAGKQAAADV